MRRRSVDSTAIASVGYDAVARTLEVEFVGGAVYRYVDVPAQEHAALLAADSLGAHMNARIRDRYRFERVA